MVAALHLARNTCSSEGFPSTMPSSSSSCTAFHDADNRPLLQHSADAPFARAPIPFHSIAIPGVRDGCNPAHRGGGGRRCASPSSPPDVSTGLGGTPGSAGQKPLTRSGSPSPVDSLDVPETGLQAPGPLHCHVFDERAVLRRASRPSLSSEQSNTSILSAHQHKESICTTKRVSAGRYQFPAGAAVSPATGPLEMKKATSESKRGCHQDRRPFPRPIASARERRLAGESDRRQ